VDQPNANGKYMVRWREGDGRKRANGSHEPNAHFGCCINTPLGHHVFLIGTPHIEYEAAIETSTGTYTTSGTAAMVAEGGAPGEPGFVPIRITDRQSR
jgi:hypothetical protein